MRIIVTGAGGLIGGALVERLGDQAIGTTRHMLNLLSPGDLNRFGKPDVVYLCAAKTRFIECEDNPEAYRVNVDAQIELASAWGHAKIVYLSSEAVERAIHTAYGHHKALAEIGLRAVCNPIIARICGKVTPRTLPHLCEWLDGVRNYKPGVYRWTT